MIITITEVTQEFTKTGAEYRKVKGITEGRETTKSVFDNLKDSWGLLKENTTLDFSLEKKGQFWNVIEIKPVALPPPTTPKILPEHQAVIDKARADVKEPVKVSSEMTKEDWAQKERITRKSIERQSTLKAATEICCTQIAQGKEMTPAKVIEIAKMFEIYLEGKEVQPVRKSLVEEAKRLGAKEIEEGG